jgi:hypothetical protein
MQHEYVNMQHKYVNMQNNYVDMQEKNVIWKDFRKFSKIIK